MKATRFTKRITLAALILAAVALLAAGCGDDDDEESTPDPTTTSTTTTVAVPDFTTTTVAAPEAPGPCDVTELTVATGEPAFPPYVIDDDPSNQMGFESAVVYAVAREMGVAAENVSWVRVGFDESIIAGPKNYDFNIQQYTITAERDQVVDFSIGYYSNEQAVIALDDSSVIGATSVDDLKSARLGAQIGTTSLDYIDNIIQPSSEARVYNTTADAKAAFDAGQIDGMVVDLPTAYFITAVEITDASIVGVLPRAGGAEDELGMLFEEGSPLVPCVNAALQSLIDSGELEEIENMWLNDEGNIPTLTS